VATGADLVAYSGFSAANYLEQPYNSDLDFGTGDFCVMGWVNTADTNGLIMGRANVCSLGVGLGRTLWSIVGGDVRLMAGVLPENTWTFVCAIRRSGILTHCINGAIVGSVADSNDASDPAAVLRVGYDGGINFLDLDGSLALWRISATAPTAEQIAKMYNDEKVLFQENAQATLYGTSDAVTALAHDSDTNLLHVGTSAGRSVFQGLRRVSNTTTAVGTAISASGGMVVDE